VLKLARQLDVRHELRRLNPECDGESLDGFQTDGTLPSLDQGDVRAVEMGSISQFLLRQPLPFPQVSYDFPELCRKAGCHNLTTIRHIRQ